MQRRSRNFPHPAWARSAEAARTTRSARPRAAEAARARGEPAAGTRTAGPSILACASLAHGERSTVEDLTVEALNRRLGVGTIHEFDEREPAGATCFPVNGEHDLGRRRDGAEIGAQVRFSRAVRQVTDEQPDSQSVISLLCVEDCRYGEGVHAKRHGGQAEA